MICSLLCYLSLLLMLIISKHLEVDTLFWQGFPRRFCFHFAGSANAISFIVLKVSELLSRVVFRGGGRGRAPRRWQTPGDPFNSPESSGARGPPRICMDVTNSRANKAPRVTWAESGFHYVTPSTYRPKIRNRPSSSFSSTISRDNRSHNGFLMRWTEKCRLSFSRQWRSSSLSSVAS